MEELSFVGCFKPTDSEEDVAADIRRVIDLNHTRRCGKSSGTAQIFLLYCVRCRGIWPVLPVHSRSPSPMRAQRSHSLFASDLGRSGPRLVRLPHPFICARFTRYSLLVRTVDDQGAGRAGDGVVIGRKADL